MIKRFSNSSIRNGQKTTKLWDQFSFAGDFESIATTTVGAGGATNITFSSIPQDYTHLQVRGIHRSASTSGVIDMQFNNDTATNYVRHFLLADGTTITAGAAITTSFLRILNSTTSASTSNCFGGFIIDILDYTNTNKFKTTKSISGFDTNSTGTVEFRSGLWRSTAAISSIKIYSEAGNNLAQYSTATLYGIKA
jgi:hypothetical protein